MTKPGFGRRLSLAACLAVCFAPLALAQQSSESLKAGKPINTGDVLSGELSALHMRSMKPGESAYQIASEPRRLPPPSGLCNLETGPETFQLMVESKAQAAQLKGLLGKQIAVKVGAIACAQEAGQVSEAVVTKWSLVKR